ncbi:MAG: hypothetical protein WEA11_08525 [Acidimicrobiales bacterium]
MSFSSVATVPSASKAGGLRDRARSLRLLADDVSPVLATSYRRRASELELLIWIHQIKSGV